MKRITDLTRAAVRATARLLPTRAAVTLTCATSRAATRAAALTLTCATSRAALTRAALILTCAATLATGLASCTADDLDTLNPGALNPDATPLTVASLPGFADTATPGTRADFDPSAPIGTTDPGKTDWAKGDTLAIQVVFFADTEPTTPFFGITCAYAIYNGSAWVLGNGLTTVNYPDFENLPLAIAGGKVAWPARAKAMLVAAYYAPGQTFDADGSFCTTRPEDAGQRELWTANTDLLTTPGEAIVLNNWQTLCARIRVAAAPGDVVKFAAPGFRPVGGLWSNPLSTPADGTDRKRPGEPVDFLTATADSLGNAYFYGLSGEKTPVTVSLTRSTLYGETETPVFQGEKLFDAPATGKSYAINALAESEWDGYDWNTIYFGTVAGLDKTKSKWVITDEAPEYTVLQSALYEIATADATRRVSIELLKAKSIGETAFFRCDALLEVSAPVATSIGESAFFFCAALQSVNLPVATNIEGNAFANCEKLTTIALPAAVNIGNDAFNNCAALQSATLPKAVSIGVNAFYGCAKLTTIALPVATEIGESAFNSCTALQSITLTKATEIGQNAFALCTALATVELPAATTFGDAVFSGCTSLATVKLGALTNIGTMFRDFTSLKTLYAPVVTSIEREAFRNCIALESITLTKAKEIGQYAFKNCTSLATVELPAATTFGGGVFSGCTALATVKLPAATNIGTLFQGSTSLKTLYAPAVTSIEPNAFVGCTSLESITLTKATEIGGSAFFGCTALESVTLTKATKIGNSAFFGCTALESVTLTKATKIGENAFRDCTSLENVTLPAATEIGNVAFDGCTALTTLTFGTPITKWGVNVLLDGANPANITLTLAAGQQAMTFDGTAFNATATGFTDFGTNKTFCGRDGENPYTFKQINDAPAAR